MWREFSVEVRVSRRAPCQVALERLVQALNLAAGLRVVGPRVLELDAEALELVLEQHLAVAVGAREDGAVVREQRSRQAMQSSRFVET